MRAKLADGKQLLNDDTLCDHRLELVVDEINSVDLVALIAVDDRVSDLVDLCKAKLREQGGVIVRKLDLSGTMTNLFDVTGEFVIVRLFLMLPDCFGVLTTEEIACFAPYSLNIDVLTLLTASVDKILRGLTDI